MDKKLDCRDIGWECDYSVCAQTSEEAIQKMGEHIQAYHAMKGFSKDFYSKAMASVREGSCELEKGSSGELLCNACFGTCLC